MQIFAWIATIVKGRPVLRDAAALRPRLHRHLRDRRASPGVMFAAIPFDQQVTDTYFVVAHFHYVLFGGAVFPIFGGDLLLVPEDDRPDARRAARRRRRSGSSSSASTSRSSRCTSSGCSGCRGASTPTTPGSAGTLSNLIATIGAFMLAVGILLVVVNVAREPLRGAPRRRRSVGRRHARVGDELAAAGSTTSPVIPRVHERRPELGPRGPRRGRAAA